MSQFEEARNSLMMERLIFSLETQVRRAKYEAKWMSKENLENWRNSFRHRLASKLFHLVANKIDTPEPKEIDWRDLC